MNKLNLTILAIALAKANCFFSIHPPVRGTHHHDLRVVSLSAKIPVRCRSHRHCNKTWKSSSSSSLCLTTGPSSDYSYSYFDQNDYDRDDNILDEPKLQLQHMDSSIIDAQVQVVQKSNNSNIVKIQGVHPIIQKSWSKLKSAFKHKPPSSSSTTPSTSYKKKTLSIFAAAMVMLSVMFFTPLSAALAAPSGGRMGGSFGGGGSSRQSYSRSYSSPSRSYNRGFSSSPSRQGYYYSRPSIIVAPASPYYTSSYGYNYGPGGVAVIRRGPSLFDVLVFGVFAFVIFNAFNNTGGGGSSLLDEAAATTSSTSALGRGVSVAQISVALNVPQKDAPNSILTYLNKLSRTARTDSRVGVSNLVSQVALELLRQRRSIFAANTKYTHYNNGEKAQRDFSNLAITERSKFERESINKYGGVDYVIADDENENYNIGQQFSPKATAAVVTIILSIDGDSTKLPVINSVSDLERALTQIASDVKVDDCLRSAEVLWTPEDPRDSLTQRDVIVDYPELRTL